MYRKNIDYRVNCSIVNFSAGRVISLFQKRICNASFLWVTDLTYTHISRPRGHDIVFVSRLLGQKSLLYFSLYSSSSSRQVITATSFPHELFKAIIPPLLSRLRERARRIKCTERFRVERRLRLFAGGIKASKRKRWCDRQGDMSTFISLAKSNWLDQAMEERRLILYFIR